MAKKKTGGSGGRIVFDWMRKGSDASAKGWFKRWEQAYQDGRELGPKGQQYIDSKYGPTVGGGGEGGGAGGGSGGDYGGGWPDDDFEDFTYEESDQYTDD